MSTKTKPAPKAQAKPKAGKKPRAKKPSYRVVYTAKVQQTGTRVSLIDNRDGKFDSGDLPWITLCEDHGNYVSHETRGVAHLQKSVPADWCDACRKAAR